MNITKLSLALCLVAVGVAGRLFLSGLLPSTPHLTITLNGITQPLFMMDLFFVVAAVSLFSGLLLGRRYGLLVPLLIMLITDVMLGNTAIFLFTWSGFAFIALLGGYARRHLSSGPAVLPQMAGAGVGAVLLYDLWTNLGCWLGWYPHTLDGLAACFTLALPFTLWHLLSTTVLVMAVAVPLSVLDLAPVSTTFPVPSLLHRYTPVAAALCLALLSLASL